MVDYEIYGGNFMLPNPYAISGVTAWGGVLDTERAAMQRLVDATLNCGGLHDDYFVLLPRTLVSFMRMDYLRSAAQPALGSFSESELNLTFVLGRKGHFGLIWYMPFVWVDSGPALISGRDVYGYPKQMAEIRLPAAGRAEADARADVLRQPGAAASRECILSAKRKDAPDWELDDPADGIDISFDLFGEQILGIDTDTLGTFFSGRLFAHLPKARMAWMRQLPNIADMRKASFRSVAEGPFQIDLHRFGRLRGDYAVHIPFNHSVQLAQTLGLAAPGSDLTVDVETAYYLECDFTLGVGQDRWIET